MAGSEFYQCQSIAKEHKIGFVTFEKSDHGVGTRAAIEPQSYGRLFRVVSRLEEPEEGVGIRLLSVNVARRTWGFSEVLTSRSM